MIAKFERERGLVELLMRRHGLTAERYIDPNKEARDETGADVIAIVGGRRIGIQVTELDTGDLPGRARVSEKAVWNDAQECGHSTYGSWAQNDPSKLVAAIARAVTSKMQQIVGCDEAWLLISASLPEMGTLASTFVITQWLPADALNAATISKLATCNYIHTPFCTYSSGTTMHFMFGRAAESGGSRRNKSAIKPRESLSCSTIHLSFESG